MYTPVKVESCVSNDEAIWLYNQAKEMNSIVELGSFTGKSTHALLSGCKGIVYAVDHFNGSKSPSDATHGRSGKEEFLNTTKTFSNLKLMEMDTAKAAELFEDQSIDMIFIDAGHLYEEFMADMKAWLPKITKLICGHDGTYKSIQNALSDLNLNYEKVKIGSLWRLI